MKTSDITKRLRRIPNAWHFRFDSTLVFTAQCFRFGGQRCSPLNAALCLLEIQRLKGFRL
ncbi:hypothetical protein ELS82_25335 [Vibrio ouci]|uniref:DUF3265 domain-containing protein n=1 Tax=Vibrio ouci TaxID=2499078 RepID=A0A4Y8W7Y9_9VIBR|nr:hypothetical protein ELS82_25335 [Vibrio ouci]